MNLQINNAGALMGLLVGDTSSTVTIDPDTGLVTALGELSPGIRFILGGTGAFDPATD